jgi:hypothetical protein
MRGNIAKKGIAFKLKVCAIRFPVALLDWVGFFDLRKPGQNDGRDLISYPCSDD